MVAPITGLGSSCISKAVVWAQGRPAATYTDFSWHTYVQTVMRRPLSFWSGIGKGMSWILDNKVTSEEGEWMHNDGLLSRRALFTNGRVIRTQEALMIPCMFQEKFLPMNSSSLEIVLHLHRSDFLLTRKQTEPKFVLYLQDATLEANRVFLTEQAEASISRIWPKRIPHNSYKIFKFSLFTGLTQKSLPAIGFSRRPQRCFAWLVPQEALTDSDEFNPYYISHRHLSKLKFQIGNESFGWEGLKWQGQDMWASRAYVETVFQALGEANFGFDFFTWAEILNFYCVDLTTSGNSADCPYNSPGYDQPSTMTVDIEFSKELLETTVLFLMAESSRELVINEDGTMDVM